MKITIDLTPLYGRKRTGVEMYAIDLYRALLNTKHQIVPIFHCQNEVDDNPNAYIIPKRKRLWLENVSLSHVVRKIKADMAIFPIFPPPIDLYYFCNTRIFHTMHDTVFLRYRDTQNLAARLYFLPKKKLALKNLDGIITISKTVQKQLSQYTNIPIYNWGENISEEYQDATKKVDKSKIEKWHLNENDYYISVSTIEPRKNFGYLLEVLAPILESKNRRLVLVGRKGWGKDYNLDKMMKLAGDRIIFTDYVSVDELFSLYHYAYAFALLSKDEGFGRTPFEAVACGCKRIILSDIDIFHETFENNALFLPLHDVDKCTKILEEDSLPLVKELEVPFNVIQNRVKELK